MHLMHLLFVYLSIKGSYSQIPKIPDLQAVANYTISQEQRPPEKSRSTNHRPTSTLHYKITQTNNKVLSHPAEME